MDSAGKHYDFLFQYFYIIGAYQNLIPTQYPCQNNSTQNLFKESAICWMMIVDRILLAT
jgi:hypothetical protein